MPWKNQSGGGGPWGSGGGGSDGPGGRGGGGNGQGPWGTGGAGGGGRRGGGGQPPNFEDMLRRGQDNVKRFLPGGIGSPRGIGIIVLLAIVVWLATGIYRVDQKEAGVELVFGKMKNVTAAGLHWNWPAPIGSVHTPAVEQVNDTSVGFSTIGETRQRVAAEAQMLTGDENIVNVEMVVRWKIDMTQGFTGVRNYLFNMRNGGKTVKDVTESVLREIVGKNEFENIRTTGRVAIEAEAAKLIQSLLNDYGAGVQVLSVQISNVDPPANVLNAFRDVQAAKADKERTVNQANAYLNKTVQEAEGEAERITRAAEAFKEERVAIARGDTRRFDLLYAEYKTAKAITRRRIYLETMREIFAGMDKIIIDTDGGKGGVVPYLPLNELNRRRGPVTPNTDGGAK
jgi:membrane protease subunit HflK